MKFIQYDVCTKNRLYYLFLVIFIFGFISSCETASGSDAIPLIIEDDFSSRLELYDTYLYDSSAKAIFEYKPEKNPGNKLRGYQGCPSIGYSDGKLFAAWISGQKDEELGNYISVAVSRDMGNTWDQDVLVIAPMVDSVRHFDPSFWKDKYGNLRLSWTMSAGMWDGASGGTWAVRIKDDNNHIVISKPRKLFNGVMNVKPIYWGADSSSILYPVSGWDIRGGYYNGQYFQKTKEEWNGAFIYKSNYNVNNRQLLTPKKVVRLPTTQPRIYDELMLLDLKNNKLLGMFRTVNGIFKSVSENGGGSWSEQEAFTELGPTASSRFYVGRLKSGNILLVMNASHTREKITAYLSTDNAATWPYKILIDARLSASYPDIVQNDEGDICMIHDYARYPRGQIIFTKFTEDDIKSGDSRKIRSKLLSSVR